MSDSGKSNIQHLGSISGAQVAVQAYDEPDESTSSPGQCVLVQQSESGRHMIGLLDLEPEQLEVVEIQGVRYWSVPHDAQIDDLLRTLSEILIAIRYLHPAVVSLRLSLGQVAPSSDHQDE